MRSFQPRNFTGCGSEGVNMKLVRAVRLPNLWQFCCRNASFFFFFFYACSCDQIGPTASAYVPRGQQKLPFLSSVVAGVSSIVDWSRCLAVNINIAIWIPCPVKSKICFYQTDTKSFSLFLDSVVIWNMLYQISSKESACAAYVCYSLVKFLKSFSKLKLRSWPFSEPINQVKQQLLMFSSSAKYSAAD